MAGDIRRARKLGITTDAKSRSIADRCSCGLAVAAGGMSTSVLQGSGAIPGLREREL